MNSVYVRPRLDRCYDVIQTKTPQFLGYRADRAAAIAFAEAAAKRSAPSTLTVYGMDGTRIEETRSYDAPAGSTRAAAPTAH